MAPKLCLFFVLFFMKQTMANSSYAWLLWNWISTNSSGYFYRHANCGKVSSVIIPTDCEGLMTAINASDYISGK